MNKMMRVRVALIAILACVGFMAGAADAGSAATAAGVQAKAKLAKNLAGLNGPFDLAGERKPEVCYFIQETQFIHLGFDGKRTGIETYTVKVKGVPAALSGTGGEEYTVREFSVRTGEGPAETIPALAGWSYVFSVGASGMDEKGQVFGIPHAKFENLTTSRGKKLSTVESYPVYNSFIDFHAFCDVFARPTAAGGIQDLKEIGQSIRHAAAFTEPPVNLGKGIKEGSVFRNGDVRLVFKGIGLVDGAACAVVGFDSGESTLKMIMPMTADKDIVTVGGSEYLGDIYIDLATRWVRKVTLDEFVVTETRLPAMGQGTVGQEQKMQAYTVRHLLIRLVSREEFEK
ncbi:MAG: hypothetical protein MUQ25_10950 [Candidatus Aminicenantes bacterium]|nr:hypothetical protein [Candidatus Aminicenantes bacterium]